MLDVGVVFGRFDFLLLPLDAAASPLDVRGVQRILWAARESKSTEIKASHSKTKSHHLNVF